MYDRIVQQIQDDHVTVESHIVIDQSGRGLAVKDAPFLQLSELEGLNEPANSKMFYAIK